MFDLAYVVWALLLGAILGSFLNALLFRFNTGKGMGGRSRCMRCGHALSTTDLIPIASYVFLRGRCRYCHTRISPQYPLVELSAAVLAMLVYITHPFALFLSVEFAVFLLWLLVWMTLLFVVVYDLRHKVIPFSASILLAFLALTLLFLDGGFAEPMRLLVGPLLALPLLLFSLVSGGRWMGWGDSQLQLGLGWLLGLTAGLTALTLAFWTGAAVGIALLVGKRGITMKSEVPFAPFLVLGAFLSHFFHVDLFPSLPYLFTLL